MGDNVVELLKSNDPVIVKRFCETLRNAFAHYSCRFLRNRSAQEIANLITRSDGGQVSAFSLP